MRPGGAVGGPPRASERRPQIIGAARPAALVRPAALAWLAALPPPQICPVPAGQIWGAAAFWAGLPAFRAGALGFCPGLAAVRAGLGPLCPGLAAFWAGLPAFWAGALRFCPGLAALGAGLAAVRASFFAILIRHAAFRSK
jgi:hypothetical protein